MLTATEIVPAPVPLTGDSVSQVWLSLTVQLRVPPPVFDTLTLCAAGFAPPAVAVKLRLAGVMARTGVAGFTVSVTATVFGEPLAPVAVTVTVPV